MKKITKILCIVSSLAILLSSSHVYAISESFWDLFDLNNIFYWDPSGDECVKSNSLSLTNNTLYNGDSILSPEVLDRINKNRSFYQSAAEKFGIPWQAIAAIHFREHSALRDNPANGQGAYQLFSYTNGGTNANSFIPSGTLSDAEFQRQTDIAAELIKTRYGNGLNLNTDNGIKTMFFRYNGMSDSYISQAKTLGYTQEEANRGEGSPYVMNLYDSTRDSLNNPSWRQITTDGGVLANSANRIPGAFVVFSLLDGLSGYSYCLNDKLGDGKQSPYSGDINATAIALAWPEHGHKLKARDSYKEALARTGISNVSDYYARIGASCDAFVATVMRYSGADPNFVCCGVSSHGATWQYVTNSGKYVEVTNSAATLQPGDIRMSNSHIEIYVEVNGVGKIASASHGDRTAEIGNFYDNSGEFKAYRLIR